MGLNFDIGEIGDIDFNSLNNVGDAMFDFTQYLAEFDQDGTDSEKVQTVP